jgi:hypothetical protein
VAPDLRVRQRHRAVSGAGLLAASGAFERRRRGDCEDFALWAWRKLAEVGVDAEFCVGRVICDDRPEVDRQHAWVVFRVDEAAYLFEPAARIRSRMIRPLAGRDGRVIRAALRRETTASIPTRSWDARPTRTAAIRATIRFARSDQVDDDERQNSQNTQSRFLFCDLSGLCPSRASGHPELVEGCVECRGLDCSVTALKVKVRASGACH